MDYSKMSDEELKILVEKHMQESSTILEVLLNRAGILKKEADEALFRAIKRPPEEKYF